MRRWVLTALQLNTYGGYASLNMNSHRTDTDLSQIVCSVHACRTKCLLFPQQAAGWVAQDVIWHVCTAQATCKSCAQVAYESSPRFACSCLGAASVLLQQRKSMISSLTAPSPPCYSALSRTSVQGKVCVHGFGRGVCGCWRAWADTVSEDWVGFVLLYYIPRKCFLLADNIWGAT